MVLAPSNHKKFINPGGRTSRLPLTRPPSCPQPSDVEAEAARRVDDLLESYMGIRDPELGKPRG